MSAKRFKARANFPVLGQAAHQEVEVMGGSWVVALGAAARAFKRLPVMRRRRVTAMSIVIELMEGQPSTLDNDATGADAVVVHQQQLPMTEDEGGT
jgi:hypothetical protein